MKIGELARASGISPSAIRYYETVGIMPPPARRNGVRQYEMEVVDELKVLRVYRASGIPIRGLASIAKHKRGSQAWRDVWNEVLRTRMVDLEVWMKEAEQVHNSLERAIECRCNGKRDNCAVMQAADAQAV